MRAQFFICNHRTDIINLDKLDLFLLLIILVVDTIHFGVFLLPLLAAFEKVTDNTGQGAFFFTKNSAISLPMVVDLAVQLFKLTDNLIKRMIFWFLKFNCLMNGTDIQKTSGQK